MEIYFSNRLEELAEKLAHILREPLDDPFQPETVVVQSRGMARWLSQQLALRHQICANYEFPFPKGLAHEVFRALDPNLPKTSPFEPDLLQWRIMRLLPQFADTAEFKSIRQYLEGDDKPLRLYQLSQKVAYIFDQYLVYRPEMILKWDKGEEKKQWQAILWRELTKEINAPHAAVLRNRALEKLSTSTPDLKSLPHRLSFFGISILPDFYVQLFSALGKHCDVRFFVFQPSKEDWSQISSKRESARKVAQFKNQFTEEDLHLEQGHPLLASWGTLGREFFKSLLENTDFENGNGELFAQNESDSLLHQLQNDILELEDRSAKNESVVADRDDSIQIRSCHTPIRELEVLNDHMLDWFQRDPQLKPRDIVVMMPNVEAYAPFIQAVFDVPEEKNRRIPFTIADRSAKNESQIVETLLKIFDLADSRCTAREVISILECRSLQQRFQISESNIELVQDWLKKSGVRWGIDEYHRASLDLPALPGNSWRQGLDRLIVGYAMAGHGEKLFHDLLPIDEIEGSTASTLGRFVEFTDKLFDFRKSLNRPRMLNEWSDFLIRTLDSFFQSDDLSERELQFIRKKLSSLSEQQELSGFDLPLDLAAIRAHLQSLLKNESLGGGFLSGGVTFCGLKPLRSLPFKIVCLLGMNDAAFPRQNPTIGFDVMQLMPKAGDPSARKDDQYLFLEALLSAREKFYVSYIGQSVKDNKPVPPSVLVSELLDSIRNAFIFPETGAKEDGLVRKHRLQAFSPDYFNGRFFSFSETNGKAFLASQNRIVSAPFISQPLSEPPSEFRVVSLRDLTGFFSNPAKYFAQNRLKIMLSETAEDLEDCEPFKIDGLNAYKLKQTLLEKNIEGVDLETLFPLLQGSGQLPGGVLAATSCRSLNREITRFAEELKPELPTGIQHTVTIEKALGMFSFSAEIKISSAGLLQFRCAKIKGADVLRAWINHLSLNLIKPSGVLLETSLIGKAEKKGESNLAIWKFRPVENAEELLADLLESYWRGLSQPLPFFPESSLAYASAVAGEKEEPLNSAGAKWFAGYNSRGEEEDIWFQFCFRDANPLDEKFCAESLKLFTPALRHLHSK